MEKRERKKHLKAALKKQFLEMGELEAYEDIIEEIDDLLKENPKNNQDNKVFLKALKTKNEREFFILSMAYFLWKYESTYLLCIDIVCRLLILTGHDLFDPIKRQFADSIEAISEVDISSKQKFLDRHNFGIISSAKFQKLRNKIAHHDYFFDENGLLHIGGEITNITAQTSEFLQFTCDIFTEICKALNKYCYKSNDVN